MPRGVGPGCNTREIAHKLIELKADIEDLEQREQELEQQKMWVQQSIKNVTEDMQNSRYPLCQLMALSPWSLAGLRSRDLRAWWVLTHCCWRHCTEKVKRQHLGLKLE